MCWNAESVGVSRQSFDHKYVSDPIRQHDTTRFEVGSPPVTGHEGP
jgi:hypothetical protein